MTTDHEKINRREQLLVRMLARIVEFRDDGAGDHIKRTTELTRILTQALLDNPQPGYELTGTQALFINKAAKLHDLGKVAVSDGILLKPGRLLPEEFGVIKTHCAQGASFIDDLITEADDDIFLHTARDIIFYHHEKWDGEGYPARLKGEEIPLSARIVALADSYEAITAKRAYKLAFSHEQALKIIQQESGTHFDPYLVSIFMKLEKDIQTRCINKRS